MLRNFGTQDGELYKPESMGMGGGAQAGGAANTANANGGAGGAANTANAADGASDTANATGKAGGTSDTSTAADGAGNSNSQMPNGFGPNNLPEGFDTRNLPEGLDLSNLPEGFDSSNMPAMGNANSGNMAQQSSSKTKNLIIYGSCFVLIIAALILVWCIRRRRNR